MVKRFSIGLGVVLMGIGLWGIATGGYAHELVIFGVNAGHNVVHVVSGGLAILAGMSGTRAATIFCLAFGAVYGFVSLAGFFHLRPAVHLLNLNTADNFLHLGIAVACLWVGGSSKAS